MHSNSNLGLDRISKFLADFIKEELDNVGIFHRVFYRVKDIDSINKKIQGKKYNGQTTFLRDVIGIRIAFYFSDDLDFAYKYIKSRYKEFYVEEAKDEKNTTEFKPERINLIFRIPKDYSQEFKDLVKIKEIDSTYELQLRTILSEGWHEVDHDLRYKFKEHWNGNDDLSRMLNGILASLETSDWSIISLFDQLSYRHYHTSNVEAMLRTKFRLRFNNDKPLSKHLETILNDDKGLRKDFFKIIRLDFLIHLAKSKVKFPLTIDNVVFYINHFFIKSEKISEITPDILKEDFLSTKKFKIQSDLS